MPAIGFIIYLGLGLLQLAAIIAGLENWIGLHWLLAAIIAFPLAYLPLVGTVIGIAGAITAWGWPWWQAGLLFFGGFGLALALGGLAVVTEKLSGRAA